jgi:hypothetical protein
LNARAGFFEHQEGTAVRDRLISAFAERGVFAELEFFPGDRLQKGAEDAMKESGEA